MVCINGNHIKQGGPGSFSKASKNPLIETLLVCKQNEILLVNHACLKLMSDQAKMIFFFL